MIQCDLCLPACLLTTATSFVFAVMRLFMCSRSSDMSSRICANFSTAPVRSANNWDTQKERDAHLDRKGREREYVNLQETTGSEHETLIFGVITNLQEKHGIWLIGTYTKARC